MPIRRTAVNPSPWAAKMGFNLGELVEGAHRTLYCAGRAAMSDAGRPQHPGDMAAQLDLTLDNVEAVLGEAGMGWEHVVRLNVYTTDVDELLAHYDRVTSRLAAVGAAPPGTLLGVSRLAYPELMVEIEATAVD